MKDADILKAFLEAATASGDPEHIVQMIGKLQTLMVSMFSLYILMEAKDHEDHKEDCKIMEDIPKAIDSFIEQLTADIRMHVSMNLEVNGVTLQKSHNQIQFERIMDEIKRAEKE